MGQSRLELQAQLELITPYVYFQPPHDAAIEYPCIIYKRSAAKDQYADDVKYAEHIRYQVTAVDRKPDSPIGPTISRMRYCTFERFYTADGLNHDVYNLFF